MKMLVPTISGFDGQNAFDYHEEIARREVRLDIEARAGKALLGAYGVLLTSGNTVTFPSEDVVVITCQHIKAYTDLMSHLGKDVITKHSIRPKTAIDFTWVGGGKVIYDYSAQESTEATFNRLVSEWRHDTAYSSSIHQMVEHPAYQQIINMGWPAVPLILKELETNGGYWFNALSEITHHDPLLGRTASMREMALAWIEWGKHNGQEDRPGIAIGISGIGQSARSNQ